LYKALQRAYDLTNPIALNNNNKEYALFNTNEDKGKVKLRLSDMLFVQSDNIDPRNKIVYTKSGGIHTIMRFSFKDLIELNPFLIQVNRSMAVSLETVRKVEFDLITLFDFKEVKLPKQVTLNRAFRKTFMHHVNKSK
jgi:hypothetical protein